MKRYFDVETPGELRTLPSKRSYWKSENNWANYNNIRKAQIHECLYAQHETWESAYQKFDERVHHFFDDKSNHRFLEMNITDGDGWDVLCRFLGVKPPKKDFPHESRF
jgi:hypothetical protein